MRKVYIKPETTTVQMNSERNLMAASGEPIYTSVSSDWATEASYGKGNSGMGESMWDD